MAGRARSRGVSPQLRPESSAPTLGLDWARGWAGGGELLAAEPSAAESTGGGAPFTPFAGNPLGVQAMAALAGAYADSRSERFLSAGRPARKVQSAAEAEAAADAEVAEVFRLPGVSRAASPEPVPRPETSLEARRKLHVRHMLVSRGHEGHAFPGARAMAHAHPAEAHYWTRRAATALAGGRPPSMAGTMTERPRTVEPGADTSTAARRRTAQERLARARRGQLEDAPPVPAAQPLASAMARAVNAKLDVLRGDPHKAHLHEQHVHKIVHERHTATLHRDGFDAVAANRANLFAKYAPGDHRYEEVMLQARARRARAAQVLEAKEELRQKKIARLLFLSGKHDEAKRRAEEQRRVEEQQQRHRKRQRHLLAAITLVSRVAHMKHERDQMRIRRTLDRKRERATRIVQAWYRRWRQDRISKRREAAAILIQRNFRMRVIHQRFSRNQAAAKRLLSFLFDVERAKNVVLLFKEYRMKVLRVQRGLRRLMVMNHARVRVGVQQWFLVEKDALAKREVQKEKQAKMKGKSPTDDAPAPKPKPAAPKRTRGRRNSLKGGGDDGDSAFSLGKDPNILPETFEEALVPMDIKIAVVRQLQKVKRKEYVRQCHAYADAYKKWKADYMKRAELVEASNVARGEKVKIDESDKPREPFFRALAKPAEVKVCMQEGVHLAMWRKSEAKRRMTGEYPRQQPNNLMERLHIHGLYKETLKMACPVDIMEHDNLHNVEFHDERHKAAMKAHEEIEKSIAEAETVLHGNDSDTGKKPPLK